ncbi:MAG TPA: putative glycoside hydrolase [Gallionella sp.]|nr:putative glycoside hydrolase [Gallionella sp.]
MTYPFGFVVLLLLFSINAVAHEGTVIDAASRKPLDGALVTLDNTVVKTDQNGRFQIAGKGDILGVRAAGHARRSVAANTTEPIELAPLIPKALYLSFYGVGTKVLRNAALELIAGTELNALVVDIKGDRGMVSIKSSTTLAAEVGAQKIITVKDIKALVGSLHEKGIYTVARIVVFKDDPLARAKPDLAVKTSAGKVWQDREKLAWVNPFNQTVWNYNIDLAVEAAKAGFDEIQFDYVRFPDAPDLVFSQPNTEPNRVAAVSGFLARARERLIPYNVFLAADVFGYVAWNIDDTGIGQKLGDMTRHLDYISLMLYPSGFQFGIPGISNPVEHPDQIVARTLERARQRTGWPPSRFRPWLQAFRDYAFGRVPFGGAQVRAQIDAAEAFGSDGWMLWNPRNVYSRDGLRPKR